MERSPEEEKQESLLVDHQEEMVGNDDPSFYRPAKTKIPYRPIDTDQNSRLIQERQESLGTSMDQMQKILHSWYPYELW